MITWRAAFERQKASPDFIDIFGKDVQMHDFRNIVYGQLFDNVTAGSVTGGATPSTSITPGQEQGPDLQNFPQGAVILGITAACVQAQTTTSAFTYAPSYNPGRRDLFALSFKYTADEELTPGGPILAEALLGSGSDTIYPGREIIVSPSQGLTATVQSYTIDPPLNVHICYHCMVLKTAT